jgi:hypothetical protein
MRKIVYMMNFKGRRSQASSGSKLRTTSSATSCVVSSVVRTTGVEVLKPNAGLPRDAELVLLRDAILITEFAIDSTLGFLVRRQDDRGSRSEV